MQKGSDSESGNVIGGLETQHRHILRNVVRSPKRREVCGLQLHQKTGKVELGHRPAGPNVLTIEQGQELRVRVHVAICQRVFQTVGHEHDA